MFHILVFNSENSEFLIPKPLKRGFYLAYSVMGDGGEGDSPLKTQLFSVSTIFMLILFALETFGFPEAAH